ncbi:MAG: hypothetical protein P4L84_13110 [Isosphaeraceae bacterium]|nr:hypothetical protein [Isosphaeraceae bacterium]
MRRATNCVWVVILAAALPTSLAAPPAPSPPAARVIGSHQVDRYAAIERVREVLLKDPNNLTDWVLLGELAQEVAEEAPADRAPGYYRLAHDSYANALTLQPNNAGLKAAARFAEEQEKKAEQIQQTRARATAAYLEARRRELARSGHAPTVRTYTTAAAVTYPRYQGYVGQQGVPYTYQEHYESFFGPVQPRPGEGEVTATERSALVKPGALAAPP